MAAAMTIAGQKTNNKINRNENRQADGKAGFTVVEVVVALVIWPFGALWIGSL